MPTLYFFQDVWAYCGSQFESVLPIMAEKAWWEKYGVRCVTFLPHEKQKEDAVLYPAYFTFFSFSLLFNPDLANRKALLGLHPQLSPPGRALIDMHRSVASR